MGFTLKQILYIFFSYWFKNHTFNLLISLPLIFLEYFVDCFLLTCSFFLKNNAWNRGNIIKLIEFHVLFRSWSHLLGCQKGLKWVSKLWTFPKNQAAEKNIAKHISKRSMKVFFLCQCHAKWFSLNSMWLFKKKLPSKISELFLIK